MAKITITADTETMSLSCKVDGEELTNLHSISLYQYPETEYSKAKLEFNACSMEKTDTGVKKTMYVYANKQLNKTVDNESLKKQITDYLNSRIK